MVVGKLLKFLSFFFFLQHIKGFTTYGFKKLSVSFCRLLKNCKSKWTDPKHCIFSLVFIPTEKDMSVLEAEIYLYCTDCLSDMKLDKIPPTIDMSIRATHGLRILSQSPYWIDQLTLNSLIQGQFFFNSLALVFPLYSFLVLLCDLEGKTTSKGYFCDFLGRIETIFFTG